MKQMLVSDFDGTFYINDEDIEVNKIAVRKFKEKGNIFVIATGRSYYDLKETISKYKIEYDYLIINHGATIINRNDEVIYNFTINSDIVSEVKKIYFENFKDNIYGSIKDKYICCREKLSRLDFDNNDLTKIGIKCDDGKEQKRIFNLINNKYSDIINCYMLSENIIEITSKETNKSKAIRLLANYNDLNIKNIYTVGDSYNDISMIKNFNGYAMVNAVDELKKIAKGQCKSVSDVIKKIIKI